MIQPKHDSKNRSHGTWLLALITTIALGGAVIGEAASFYAANNGVDSGACGSSSSPCRSVSQAIANAAAGDTINVGPGRYGDLNDDGDFLDAGDEAAEEGTGCDCMIKVNKKLTIVSSSGAAATILDAGGESIDVVSIEANEVVFGASKKGFTITGADSGSPGLNTITGTTGVVVTANLSVGNDNDGFLILGEGHTLNGNQAIGNGGDGFDLDGGNHILSAFISNANEAGVEIGGTNQIVQSGLVTGNDEGINVVGGTGHTVTGNAILGNYSFGVFLSGVGASATITGNNIYGNNDKDTSGATNCGLRNESGGTVDATGNFWGLDSGLGIDPADQACDDGVGSATTTSPPATKPIKVKVKSAL